MGSWWPTKALQGIEKFGRQSFSTLARAHRLGLRDSGWRTDRKENRKTGAAIVRMHPAAHSDGTAKPIRNPACDPQAKPSPVFSLCGEKRFEDSSSMVAWNAAAAVGKSDSKPVDRRSLVPGSGLANAQYEASTDRHSIDCIDQKSGEYLPNLSWIAKDRSSIGRILLLILAFWFGPAVAVNFGPPVRVLATLRGWGEGSVAG